MDTTFWGPSGHKLLHSIALYCDTYNTYDLYDLSTFFKSIGHILPCIYCRRSYQKYYKELPLSSFLKEKKSVSKWYYLVHNKINKKLRDQGYLNTKDPKFKDVLKKYENILSKSCFIGWNFLYSIVYHYPHDGNELSNRRYEAYVNFFNLLSLFYPVESIRKKYKEYLDSHPIEKYLDSSESLLKWLYHFEKKVNPRCCTFEKRCSKLEKYHVKKCVNKSCRN